jgi:hypothetical protein
MTSTTRIKEIARPVSEQIFRTLRRDAESTEALIAFFGHHKCASTWAGGILWEAAEILGLRRIVVNFARTWPQGINQPISAHRAEVLNYTNAEPMALLSLPRFRGFHLIRDPRDICVSAYYSHLKSHELFDDWPELQLIREKLQSLSFEDGLAWQIENLANQFSAMEAWDYAQPNIQELRFEDVIAAPTEIMVHVLEWLGLATPEGQTRSMVHEAMSDAKCAIMSKSRTIIPLRSRGKLSHAAAVSLVWDRRFEKLTKGRQRGIEDASSHYRKGVSGDWLRTFTSQHREVFNTCYPNLLQCLGYEDDDSWCRDA